jgi:hypothetical protein
VFVPVGLVITIIAVIVTAGQDMPDSGCGCSTALTGGSGAPTIIATPVPRPGSSVARFGRTDDE